MLYAWRRVSALTLICCLPLWAGFLFWTAVAPTDAAPSATGQVIINEWSQGTQGSEEWVELLVLEESLDMRGWDLGDDSPGDLTFANVAFWSAVPVGSLIVLYNNSGEIPLVPDLDWSDGIVVVPHNHPDGLFTGSWPLLSNSNPEDNPHLRNDAAQTVHDFSQEPGSDSSIRPGATQGTAFQQDTVSLVGEVAAWLKIDALETTPGAGNSVTNTAWIESLRGAPPPPAAQLADLLVEKTAPATLPMPLTTAVLTYHITLANQGNLTATAVRLTDTLPLSLTYLSDSSGQTPQISGTNQLVWTWTSIPTATSHSFVLSVSVPASWTTPLTNHIYATTAVTESNLNNNQATAVTTFYSPFQPQILLDAVLTDGWANSDADEAIALRNVGQHPADLSGWEIRNGTNRVRLTLPEGIMLAPGEVLWTTKQAAAFRTQFGHWPDVAFIVTGSDPESVAVGTGSWQNLSNAGGSVTLYNEDGLAVDSMLYGTTTETPLGWTGTAVTPFKVGNAGLEGQILYRQRDQHSNQPFPDTNTATDWAQSPNDLIHGRKIRYPGWHLEEFFFTRRVTNTAVITLAVAPDNAFETLVSTLNQAQESIQIEMHTFENIAVLDALVQASQRGVSVTVLLEGSPPGGIADQQRYICQQLEQAGGACWYMINDSTANIHNRYVYLHTKFVLIDHQKVIISSENLSPNSLPDDDKTDGTWGRRGVLMVTDAPEVVAHVAQIFAADFAPHIYQDLRRYDSEDDQYGPPPFGFVPLVNTGGTTYTVRYPEPFVTTGTFPFELVQSPENSLRSVDGLLGLIEQAGQGDTILVQQLSERPYWGATTSNAVDDPNVRLEAYLDAARRGAWVWLLLDELFDNPNSATSNAATCAYITAVAQTEQLSTVRCERANPTGLGIHNKMVLMEIHGRGYVHLGSLNGTEQSHKANRELAVQVQSDALFAYLQQLFFADWPFQMYFPVIMNQYIGPATHLLISELVYDPPGPDEAEFIELYNPTSDPIDLSFSSLSDAHVPENYADLRRFPEGTFILPKQVLVVTQQAVAFQQIYGRVPDFELLETDPNVPNLYDDPHWGDTSTYLQLGNGGDVLYLRDAHDEIIDMVAYGEISPIFDPACPLVEAGHSLRRNPYWRTTNNCPFDFEAWPAPTPGRLP